MEIELSRVDEDEDSTGHVTGQPETSGKPDMSMESDRGLSEIQVSLNGVWFINEDGESVGLRGLLK